MLSYYRILNKDFVLKELFVERHGFHGGNCHINELRLLVEADIVVADVGVLACFNANVELLLGQALCHQVVADSNRAFLDEIHFSYLIFFVQNELIMLVEVKLGRLKPKTDVI